MHRMCFASKHMLYSVCTVQCKTRTPQLFKLGKGVYNFLDSVVRALEFNSVALLLTVKPASPILT